ncbi:uncharacterized protein LOC143864207 isoform X2 [Tasmannia lanceolata]|uniref:uncharacterized protein LOC143864207 isoform X2 n=1 Tax=Tasmannia lanceolata TaxID=3420 RepID=UPI004062F28B
MGKVVEKKKKKGRPSLLDLQKRNLREQQLQQQQLHKRNPNSNTNLTNPNPNPNSDSHRRLTRRNPNPDGIAERNNGEEEDDEDSIGNRREKKLKLFLRLPRGGSDFGSDSNGSADFGPGSNVWDKAERQNSGGKATDPPLEVLLDSGPTTPLPDKKLLVFILDRLQKKDTYGVFSEQVDPKELPDYHEIIEHPMDFSTVRMKVSSGAYATLEQFEKDVFLICSNAMRYNAPDTIYFRQARSIQELARKDFENLRQDSEDNEPELKPPVRRGRPPGKTSFKRLVGRLSLERAGSDFSSDATLATAGDNAGWCNSTHDQLRKAHDKAGITDASIRNSHGTRNGSLLKGLSKVGSKQFVFDENRRSTYKQPHQSVSGHEPTVLTTFDREKKQLISVGLHMELSYARSLARFAANLGPVAWKIASKKIEKVLPTGLKFGPGWVGENESQRLQLPLPSSSLSQLPTPSQSSSQPRVSPCITIPCESGSKGEKLSDTQEPSNNSSLDGSSRTPPSTNKSSDTTEGSETIKGTNYETRFSLLNGSGGIRSNPHIHLNQSPAIHSTVNNGFKFNSEFEFNLPSRVGNLVRSAGGVGNFSSEASTSSRMNDNVPSRNNIFIHSSMPANRLEAEGTKLLGSSNSINPGSSLPESGHKKLDSVPPDLNVRFQSPGSPVSGVLVDSQQPDLALQL